MKSGISHWIVVPLAFIVAVVGVNIVGPLAVDFLVQDVLSLSEQARPVPMLSIDLLLSTAILVAVFYWAGSCAASPKLRAQATVAVLLLVFTVWLRYAQGLYVPGAMPVLYEVGVVGTVPIGWYIARRQLQRAATRLAAGAEA